MKILDVEVTLADNCRFMGVDEIKHYILRVMPENGVRLTSVYLSLLPDGNVEIQYETERRGFERIRRITGYLVGTTDRFNNAKRDEERDRVKHLR